MNPESFSWTTALPQTIVMVVGVAAAAAYGVVWVMRRPQLAELQNQHDASKAQIKALQESFDLERIAQEARIKHVEKQVEHAEKRADEYIEKLRICKEANMEMGIRIRQLEETSEHDHEHPLPE